MAGKRIKAAAQKIEKGKPYALKDAVAMLKVGAPKFDQTVDVAINLGIDPTQSDQMVRGMVGMPNGLGKTVRVAVFAKGDKAEAAKKAGADIVGGDDLAEMVVVLRVGMKIPGREQEQRHMERVGRKECRRWVEMVADDHRHNANGLQDAHFDIGWLTRHTYPVCAHTGQRHQWAI